MSIQHGVIYCRATRRVGTRAGRRAMSVRGPITGFVDGVQD